jgi:HEAT repeat protein
MYAAIIWTVVVLAVLVVSLSAFVVLGRLALDWRSARRRQLRSRMSAALAAWLGADLDPERALAALSADRAVALEALARTANALRPDERARLTPLFRHFGFVAQETAALRHRNWSRRLTAAGHLGVMGDPGVVPALVHALGDEMLDVRVAAARALAQLPAPQTVALILQSLALPGELPLKLTADVLAEFGDSAVEPLLTFLRGQHAAADWPALAVVITVLGLSRATVAVPLLIATLGHAEPELRVNAARALGLIASPQALAALGERMLDPVWQVRGAAAQALGLIGDDRAVASLTVALTDSAWWVRFNAAEALFRLGDPGRERLLETLTAHEDRFARDISRQVLEEHGALAQPEAQPL